MKPKAPPDVIYLVGWCEAGHKSEMKVEGDAVMPDKALEKLVKDGVLCPHCKKKMDRAEFQRRPPS